MEADPLKYLQPQVQVDAFAGLDNDLERADLMYQTQAVCFRKPSGFAGIAMTQVPSLVRRANRIVTKRGNQIGEGLHANLP